MQDTGVRRIDYVLPLKWHDDSGLDDLTAYLNGVREHARVVVVDGSPDPVFDRHAAVWDGIVDVHVRPDPLGYRNGKVSGVTTGLRLAHNERVVIADDDVRYTPDVLHRTVALLDEADLVGPQNYFDPLPWHAAWDTSRTLLNRAARADYPGTFAVRRSTFLAMGGYDGDVLFENLELMRTVRAHGGTVVRPLDIYVRRVPPDAGHFWSQRVRQAYDDLAQPGRLVPTLAVLPATVAAVAARRSRLVAAAAATAVLTAEAGRCRSGGTAVFRARTSWFAPLWLAERAVCSWVALGARVVHGGVRYAGARLLTAAHSEAELRRRAASAPGVTRRRAEPDGLVRPVAEGLERAASAAAQRHRPPTGVDDLAVRSA